MSDPEEARSLWARVYPASLGGLAGGLIGGLFVVEMTMILKLGMDTVAAQDTWVIIVVPLVGLTLAALVLQVYGRGEGEQKAGRRYGWWRTFPPGAVRADITGDIVDSAGQEERFPWRLAPIRAVAIVATVGSGAAMGTEAPAAYLGVAAGACVADRAPWRRWLRPVAVGAGAAGVAALMGVALVGTAYLLEMGRRRAPITIERGTAALIGGLVGWGINVTLDLDLIRLIVPKEPPRSLMHAAIIALFIGGASGGISSLAARAIYHAKKWQASPLIRLTVGGLATLLIALALVAIASPSAAVGPGGGAILWSETTAAVPLTLLAVCLLRAAATTAAAAAGGCGGVFVPFLAVGDLAGRVFAPGLGVGADLSGAAGAAGGIAGGYRLPLTAVVMVLGIGGPTLSKLTSLAAVVVATFAGKGVDAVLDRLTRPAPVATPAEVH